MKFPPYSGDSLGKSVHLPDFESPSSGPSSPKILDTSSFRRKKLFALDYDDEWMEYAEAPPRDESIYQLRN